MGSPGPTNQPTHPLRLAKTMKLSDSFLEEMHEVRAEQLANAGLSTDQPLNMEAHGTTNTNAEWCGEGLAVDLNTEAEPAAHGTTDTEAEWWGEDLATDQPAADAEWWGEECEEGGSEWGCEEGSEWWLAGSDADAEWWALNKHAFADLTQPDTDTCASAPAPPAAIAAPPAANAAPADESNTHGNTTADRLQNLSLPEWTPPPNPKAKANSKQAKKPATAKSAAQPKPKARAPQGEDREPKSERKETDYAKLKKKFLEPLQLYNKKEQEKRRGQLRILFQITCLSQVARLPGTFRVLGQPDTVRD